MRTRFIPYVLLGFLFVEAGAQEALTSGQSLLRRQQEISALHPDAEKRVALEFARRHGLAERVTYPDGRISEIRRLSPTGLPMYYITHNLVSAETVSSDNVWQGGADGLDLTGAGIVVGVWDGGTVLTSHDEFGGRARILDGSNDPIDHGTHVAGTIAAAGVRPNARGMASQAIIDSYDWDNETSEIRNAAGNGMLISNHSYGFVHGWNYDSDKSRWEWYGDISLSETEDYGFGYYGSDARIWDQIMNDHPRYMLVKSAGNDRGEGPAPGTSHFVFRNFGWQESTTPRDIDGGFDGYDCIGTSGTAKNILTVGAVRDIPGGYTKVSDVEVTSFSAFGPTDDGRIKPDLVANGTALYSSTAGSDSDYGFSTGTSMSAPSVAGSLALLQEHHNDLYGNSMFGSQLKALVIHSADEAGRPGPDYQYGWGLLNTSRAAGLISTLKTENFVYDLLQDQEVREYVFYSTGNEEIRVTMVWNDPAGNVPPVQVDPTDRILVNDLDMTLTRQLDNHVFRPWVLEPVNPSRNAGTGDNNVDNVEQIVIAMPSPGFYTLRVDHDGSLSGGQQAFALVVTGMDADYVASGREVLEESNGSVLLSSAEDYLNNMEVEWLIQPGNGNRVSFYFDWFETEAGNDVLTIYDGGDTLAPLLAQFSGTLSDTDTLVVSSGDTMLVTFRSDDQITGRGFLARYCTTAPEGSYTISGEGYPCSESTSPYFALGQDGAYFTWESGDWEIRPLTTNGIDLSIGSARGTLTVQPFNRCGSGAGSQLDIEPLNAPPILMTVEGDSSPCAGNTAMLTTTFLPGAIYQWDLPASWIGSSSSDTLYYKPGTSAGTITVRSINACGSSNEVEQLITVSDVPQQASILTDKVPPCALTRQRFFVTPKPGHTFTWETRDDWRIFGSDTGDTVTVDVGQDETFLFVTSSNKCGETEASRLFLTSPVPPLPELAKTDGSLGLPELEVTNIRDMESIRWYRNGIPVSGAQGASNPLVVNLNGVYWAESVSEDGCTNPESAQVQLEVDRKPLSFLAYRVNETTVVVENTTENAANFRIYSLAGQAVYNGKADPGHTEIGFLGTGVYLFQFTGGGMSQDYKVLL